MARREAQIIEMMMQACTFGVSQNYHFTPIRSMRELKEGGDIVWTDGTGFTVFRDVRVVRDDEQYASISNIFTLSGRFEKGQKFPSLWYLNPEAVSKRRVHLAMIDKRFYDNPLHPELFAITD